MAKIARFNGDVRAFGSTATGTDRTIFGDTAQSDLLDDNLTANFLTGWGILAAGAKPPKEYFNGALYTATQFIAYLHEEGIAEWNTSQKYYIGSLARGSDNVVYSSVTGTDPTPNTGTDPSSVTDGTVWKISSNPYQNETVTHDITVDSDYTLTAFQNKYGRIIITDTSVLLTVARNIVVDNSQRALLVQNDTLQILTFKTAAGTGVAVSPGATVKLYNDGTDVINLGNQILLAAGAILPSITGTATFTNASNNINLIGIGSLTGIEVGDVIRVTNSVSNNKEFTVESITDADNVIVNAAHAGGTTTKSLIGEVSTAGVTIEILAKWFNAPMGIGQGLADVTGSRILTGAYQNLTGRSFDVLIRLLSTSTSSNFSFSINGVISAWGSVSATGAALGIQSVTINPGDTYTITAVNASIQLWQENR